MYNFTVVGATVKVINTDTNSEIISSDVVKITAYTGMFQMQSTTIISIVGSVTNLQIPMPLIGTINGVAAAATPDLIINQLSAIYPTATVMNIADPTTPGNKASVQAFHNADNQSLGGAAYGILSGGVAQLLNPIGNLDRQRETGIDSVPAVGVPSSATQNAQPFTVTHAASTTIGTTVFTPSAMSGFSAGAPWSIQIGSVLTIEPTPIGGPVPANQEAVVVTAVTGTTFTAVTKKAHTGSFSIGGFVYNQNRDATVADGSPGIGFGAQGNYLWNQALNIGLGGWERDRSAAGELDGATGQGTAVAAEYEYNGGGPGGANYDRARSIQAKLRNSGTITGAQAAGVSSLTLSAIVGLQAGEQVTIDRGTGTAEALYVSPSWNGVNPVTFTSATQFAHANGAIVEWDDFAVSGPGLNGFTATGIGIEEEALFNPVDNLFYLERAATQDAMPTANIVAESPALFNGATMDRQRGNFDTGALVTLTAAAAGGNSADQVNYNGRGLQLLINITAITGTSPTLTVTIQGKDTASGAYYTILASAALTATGATLLTVYPGGLNTANVASPTVLPRTWRVLYAIGGTTPAVTATVGASVIV